MTDRGEPDGEVWLNGKPHRLERVGRVDKPSPTDTFWQAEGDMIEHPTIYLDLTTEQDDITLPDDPGWYDPVYRLIPRSPTEEASNGP